MHDPRWGDPRDRDDDPRDIEIHWIELGRGADPREDDPHARDENVRERDRDGRERDHDPRDVFVCDLDLPRGLEREVVIDGDHRYELNGDESRSLPTVGAFRAVSERDLRDLRDEASDPRDMDLRHLRDEGLMRFVAVDGRERAVTLTERGHHLDQELKREYQEWLQERNRGRPDSNGRPDRDEREIEDWARDHELPYVDAAVNFPDFRIEYDLQGRDRHEDVEVVTEERI